MPDKSDYQRVYTWDPGGSRAPESRSRGERGQPRGLAAHNGERVFPGVPRPPIQTGRRRAGRRTVPRRSLCGKTRGLKSNLHVIRCARKNNGRYARDHSSTKGRPICGSSSICFLLPILSVLPSLPPSSPAPFAPRASPRPSVAVETILPSTREWQTSPR